MPTLSLTAARRQLAVHLRGPELDRRLAAGERDRDGRLADRARLLASARTREGLARALREIVAAAERPPAISGRVPLARAEVSAAADDLRLLASRLQAPGPVDPRGVAEVRMLLVDGCGPLYNERSKRRLDLATSAARRDLTPPSRRPAPLSEPPERRAARPRRRQRPPARPR
jgi:hypothetical protein